MKKLITYIRLNHPILYANIIQFSKLFQKKNKTIHVLDDYGGDFKLYMFKYEMTTKLEQLTKGLDEYSLKTVDTIITRLQNYPNRKYGIQIKNMPRNVVGDLLEEESDTNKKRVKIHLKRLSRKLNYSRFNMDASVFYYYHGLTYLPGQVKNYIADNDFLDLGAFSGDSAIALSNYNYRKIYSVEMSEKAIQNYKVNVARNKIDTSRYQIIRAAITNSDKQEPIYFSDNTYTVFSDKLTDEKNAKYKVSQRSVDSIVEEYKIQPKLIKVDIEGFGLDCVKGATQTLIKYRPVLSLAIYHNPYEFFETKPLLENILVNYTFLIRKMTTSPFGLRCHAETILLGYPNEVLKV